MEILLAFEVKAFTVDTRLMGLAYRIHGIYLFFYGFPGIVFELVTCFCTMFHPSCFLSQMKGLGCPKT